MRKTYTSAVREAAARQTRQQVLDAAERLFLAAGYAETTVTAIAAAAGVSAQTVYNTFGNKAALLKKLYDVRLVGDDEPVPLAGRPEIGRVAAAETGQELITAYVQLGAILFGRLGPLIRLIAGGAVAGDRDLGELLATTAGERLVAAGRIAGQLDHRGWLRPGLTVDEARDVIWALTGIELWDLLGRQRGWDQDRVVSWLTETMAHAVLPIEPAGAG